MLKTDDLTIFKKCEFNREIDKKNLSRIIDSIKSSNLLELRPILVNEQMEVIDGQHRLEAAKMLNLPIYYIIDKNCKVNDIVLLNANSKVWSTRDYINFFCGHKNEHYMLFNQWCIENNVDYNVAILLFFGRSNDGYKLFKKGNFKFDDFNKLTKKSEDIKNARECIELINRIKPSLKKLTSLKRFFYHLCRFISRDDVDLPIFLKKIEYKIDLIHNCASAEGYQEIFKNIYNWKNSDPI